MKEKELGKEETLKVMAGIIARGDYREAGDFTEVKYNGEWLELVREDLARQVRSAYHRGSRSALNDVQEYSARACLGARVDGAQFCVIDSRTDG